jgi:hypothetical protein
LSPDRVRDVLRDGVVVGAELLAHLGQLRENRGQPGAGRDAEALGERRAPCAKAELDAREVERVDQGLEVAQVDRQHVELGVQAVARLLVDLVDAVGWVKSLPAASRALS